MSKKAQVTVFVIFGLVLIAILLFILFSSRSDDPVVFVPVEGDISLEEFELVFDESEFFVDTFYSLRSDWERDLSELSFEELLDFYVEKEINLSVGLGVGYSFLRGGVFDSSSSNLVSVSGPVAFHIGEGSVPSEDVIINNLESFIVDILSLQFSREQFRAMNVYFDRFSADVVFNHDSVVGLVEFRMIDSSLETTFLEYELELPLRVGRVLEVRDEVINNFNIDPNNIESFAYDDLEVNFLFFDDENLIISIQDSNSDLFGEPLIYNFAVNHVPSSPLRFGLIPDFVTEVGFPVSYNLDVVYHGDDDLTFSVNSDLVEIDSDSGIFTFSPASKGTFNFEICAKNSFAESCSEVTVDVI